MGSVVRSPVSLFFGGLWIIFLVSGCAPKFNFHPGAAIANNFSGGSGPVSYQLVFTTQPSSTVASGGALPTGGVIEVEDNNGNLITTGSLSTATIALSDSSGNGGIAGVTSVTATGGIATIPDNTLMFEKGGTKSIAATTTVSGYGTLTGESTSINVTIPSISTVAQFSGPDDPAGDVDGYDIATYDGGEGETPLARLYYPESLTQYGSTIYFIEGGGNNANNPCVIRTYDTSSGQISTWIGQLYNCTYNTGAPGTGTIDLGGPGESITNDGSTYVYFTHNGMISRADFATGTISSVAGVDGDAGYVDNTTGSSAKFAYNGDTAGSNRLYLSGSTLYLADRDNCVIRAITLSGLFPVSTYAGTGACAEKDESSGNPLDAKFDNPTAIYGDGSDLYVLDNEGLRVIDTSTGNVSTLETSTSFAFGGSIAIEGSDFYVDNGETQIFELSTSTGDSLGAVAGQAYTLGEVDGGPSVSYISDGFGSLMTSGSDVYVNDEGNDAIRVLNTSTDDLTTLAGIASSGMGSADGSSSTAQFVSPQGAASDGTYLYTVENNVDSTNSIRRISLANGSVTTEGASWGLSDLQGESEAMIGNMLYIAVYSPPIIYAVDTTTWTLTTLAGNGTQGNVTGSFSNARFEGPFGLTTDGSNLYVEDDNSIKKLDLATETVSVISGTTYTDGCQTGSASASQYDGGGGIGGIVYLSGYLYVASDCFGGGIVQVDVSTGASTLFAGNQTSGYQDGTLGNAEFGSCYMGSCSITADGVNLYLYDYYNGLVREINPAGGASAVSTLWGNVNQRWQVDGTVGTSGTAREGDGDWPYDVLYYGYGKFYVVHSRGVRVAQ